MMKPNPEKLNKLIEEYYDGNFMLFANEYRLRPHHLRKFLTQGTSAGKKTIDAIVKCCEDKGLDIQDYIDGEPERKRQYKTTAYPMSINREKLVELMNTYCNGNYNRFARELGVNPAHLHRFISTGVGGGTMLIGSVMRFCQEKGLDFGEYVKV